MSQNRIVRVSVQRSPTNYGAVLTRITRGDGIRREYTNTSDPYENTAIRMTRIVYRMSLNGLCIFNPRFGQPGWDAVFSGRTQKFELIEIIEKLMVAIEGAGLPDAPDGYAEACIVTAHARGEWGDE